LAKEHDKWQNSHGARLQKQLQTALILSVTSTWSHPWVRLNGLWFSNIELQGGSFLATSKGPVIIYGRGGGIFSFLNF
jgi:hypothetical protein